MLIPRFFIPDLRFLIAWKHFFLKALMYGTVVNYVDSRKWLSKFLGEPIGVMSFSGPLCIALWNPTYSGSRPQDWIMLPSSVEKAPLLIMEKGQDPRKHCYSFPSQWKIPELHMICFFISLRYGSHSRDKKTNNEGIKLTSQRIILFQR